MQREFSQPRQLQSLATTRSFTGLGDEPGPDGWPVAFPAAAVVEVGKAPHLGPRPLSGDSLGDRCRHNLVFSANKMNLRNQTDAGIVRRVKRVAQRVVVMMQSPGVHIQQAGNGYHGDRLVQPGGNQQGERTAATVADEHGAPQRIQCGLKSGDHTVDNRFGVAGGGPPTGITSLISVAVVTGPRYINDSGGRLFHQGERQRFVGGWVGADLSPIRGPGSPVALDENNLGAGLVTVEQCNRELPCNVLDFLQPKSGSSLLEWERMSRTGGEKNR